MKNWIETELSDVCEDDNGFYAIMFELFFKPLMITNIQRQLLGGFLFPFFMEAMAMSV